MKGRKSENQVKVSPFIGEQGLARLVRQARIEYQKEVLAGRKTYHRFSSDFLASIIYHDSTDAWSKNEHNRNIQAASELLLKNKPLIDFYFNMEELSEDSLHDLIRNFNKGQMPSKECSDTSEANLPKTDKKSGVTKINDNTISFIVQCANEAELFLERLSKEHFVAYYEGHPLPPLTSANNEKVVLFFKILENEGLIRHNWQHIIDRDKLIKSSSGRGFLTKAVMASTLSRVTNRVATANDTRLVEFLTGKTKEYKASRVI